MDNNEISMQRSFFSMSWLKTRCQLMAQCYVNKSAINPTKKKLVVPVVVILNLFQNGKMKDGLKKILEKKS